MQFIKYIIYFLTMLSIGYLYNKYKESEDKKKITDEYELVRKYLLTDETNLVSETSEICWIHIPYEINARSWLDFYSRNTNQLNKPYIYLCIKSIIEQNGTNMKICIVDDNSFAKLLPSWKIDMTSVPEPSKKQVRALGMSKLLYYYGGISVPHSFVCARNLLSLLRNGRSMFCVETRDHSVNSSVSSFMPSPELMGCVKNSNEMKEYIQYLERNISTDYTFETSFINNNNRVLLDMIQKERVSLLDAGYVGQKDINGNEITIDRLLRKEYIDFNPEMYGILVDDNMLEKRTHYNWFIYLDKADIIQSDVMLAKYLTAASYYSM
jgi:hypothetical protein